MHKSIDKILASLMAEKGISQINLARKTEVNQSTISRILKPNGPKGIKEPTDKQVRPLADFFGVTTDQLRGYSPIAALVVDEDENLSSSAEIVSRMLSRHGKNLPNETRQKIETATAPEGLADSPRSGFEISADTKTIPPRPGRIGDEVWIAHYDVRAAMGDGESPDDFPEMLQDVRVSPKHLREMGVEFKEHYHLKMITGWGQSMEPTIRHRDPLIVDVSIRDFTGDGIYFLTWGGHVYIKRLQISDDDHFEMISDNARHKDRMIRRDDTYIQARVLLVWNAHLV